MKKNNSTKVNSAILHFFLCLMFVSVVVNSYGQTAATYVFTTSSGTYTPITGGTVLSSGTGMDDAMFSVTIPSFTYLGTAYTQVYVDENGYIQFGTTSPTTSVRSYLSSTDATAKSGIAGYSKDLGGKSATSELRTQTIGSEVIFQWTNLASFLSTSQTVTFQIRLNTTTNVIMVVYKMSATASTTAQVGLRGSLTDFNNRSSTTSWTASVAGLVNSATMTLSSTVAPVFGQTYIWSPPPPCSGKPAGGIVASSAGATAVCPFTTTTLSVTGSTVATGIAYAWDSSALSATGPWSPIAGATASSYTSSLPACSNIYYRRRTICVPAGLSDSSTSVLVSVKCALAPPYFENFESITVANQLPNCMTATSLGSLVFTNIGPNTHNRDNHTPGGSKYASFEFGCNDYIFTPGIVLTAGKTYEFSFWYDADGLTGFDSLTMRYGTVPSASGMTTTLGVITNIVNTTYKKYKVRFTILTSGVRYFGIKCNSNFVPWFLNIDDIGLQEVLPCSGAPAIGATSASPTRVCGTGVTTLDLPSLPSALGYAYQWQDSTSGGTWGSDATRPSFGGTLVPFTTGIITKNTYFRCIVRCAFTGDSAVSSPILVNAGAYDVPYIQDFESISADNELPQCMSATSINPFVQTFRAPMANNRQNHTLGGSKYACFHWSSNDYLFSPPINFIGGQQYILSFWYITDGLSGWNTLSAAIGTAPIATSMTASLKAITNPKNTTYVQYIDTFKVPISGVYYFGIYCNANAVPFFLSFDDINLQARPCSGPPAGGNIVGSVPSGTGVCSATRVMMSNIGATPNFIPGIVYQWQRRPISVSLVWKNVLGANDSILNADTLAGYEYRVAVVCTKTGDTSFSSTFSLPQLPPHPPVTIAPSTSPIMFCLGDTVKFNATNFAGGIYDWILDSALVSGWKFSDFGATAPGHYFVRVRSPLSPCPAYSNMVELDVNDPGYKILLSVPTDSIICEGSSVLLSGLATKAGVKYQWRKNNIIISGATSNSYTATTSGVYSLSAIDGVAPCPAMSRNIRIIVNPNPPASITIPSGSTTACEGVGVLLQANSGSYSYQWLRGGTTVVAWTDSVQLVNNSGIYTVQVRSANGCTSLSSSVNVTILPAPIPVITRTGYVLSTTLSYPSYQWMRNGVLMSGRTNDTLQLTLNGAYQVRVKDSNGCEGVSVPVDILESGLNIGSNLSVSSDQINIYPNPTNAKVYISTPVALNVEVKDILGKTLLNIESSKEIDLSKYPDGVYLFIVRNGTLLLKQQRVTKITQ